MFVSTKYLRLWKLCLTELAVLNWGWITPHGPFGNIWTFLTVRAGEITVSILISRARDAAKYPIYGTPQQRIIWSKLSIALRLQNPELNVIIIEKGYVPRMLQIIRQCYVDSYCIYNAYVKKNCHIAFEIHVCC